MKKPKKGKRVGTPIDGSKGEVQRKKILAARKKKMKKKGY
jgi:hypothetical protein